MTQINGEFLVRRAKELQADEGFKAIVKALKERAIFEWANTPSHADGKREELYRDVQAVGRLENVLSELISGDKFNARKAEKAALKGGK
jgi:hypothetical protein